jgi:hypothetical protein
VSRLPWSGRSLRALVVMDAAALAVIVVGWFGASGAAIEPRQIAWLSVAASGLVLSGLANGRFVVGGRRAVLESRARVLAGGVVELEPEGSGVPLIGEGQRVSGVNMTLYHQHDCPLAAGKDVRSAPRSQFEGQALAPCEVCQA